MENVSQLQPTLTPQIQTSSSEAPEKDADFLALRLLNKRSRLRLSPEPLDLASFPGKANLFTTLNSKGWFAAITRDANGASALILSPLADLRSALAAASAEDERLYTPQRRVPISGAAPHILTFGCNSSRLLLGSLDGSIRVYDTDRLLSDSEAPVQPLHVFTTSSSSTLLSIQPNPGDIPELVAVLRDCASSPGSLAVELFDMQKLISSGGWVAGKSPSTTPTSISWSPKGKQLALGLQNGDIVTFSPNAIATPKSSIPHPLSVNNMSLISVHWLSTSSFHTIYAPPGHLTPDVEQIHFHVSMDSKNNSAQSFRFNNPYLSYPGLRPPGEFLVCLRGWDPSKVLLFIGDSTSSDIGLIGSVASDAGEGWYNLSVEETSTPSLPLDKDQNDTILLGLDVDLTNGESYHHSTASGEMIELPAHPILYVYASDGTILGWHVLNVTGAPYPGMVTSAPMPTPPSVPSSMVRELSSDMQTTPTISPTASAPTEASATGPPSTIFGQPSAFGVQSSSFDTSGSAFGQPSIFGQSGFNQQSTSVFNKTSFGQIPTTSAFGSTSSSSPFGQSSASAFGPTAPGAGFGAFSLGGPSKFGQTSFGFSGPPQVIPQSSSISIPEESMAADAAPSFGGLGLGAVNSEDADSKPSIFGKVTPSVSSSQQATNGGLIKPATGFGPFAGFNQDSPFAKISAFSSTAQGSTTFAAAAFPSSLDVSNPQVADSKPSVFGKVSLPAPSAPKPIDSSFIKPGTGFAAFASFDQKSPFAKAVSAFPSTQQGSATFGATAFQTKPENAPSTSFGTGQSVFGASTPTFGKPTFGQSSFSQIQASTSAFGKTSFGATSSAVPLEPTPINVSTGGAFSAFASSTQSAFGAVAAKSSPSAKPVWAITDSPNSAVSSTTAGVSPELIEPPEPKAPSVIPTNATDATIKPSVSASASASSISSASSSYVKVSAEEGEIAEEGIKGRPDDVESILSDLASDSKEEEEGEEEGDDDDDDDGDDDDEEVEEEEEEGDEAPPEAADEETEEQVEKRTEPTEIPVPTTLTFTRSPSTTPKAEHPKIRVSVSPPPQIPSPSGIPRASPARDLGTTPPGSPVKDIPWAPAQMPVPVARSSPPPTTPFGLAPRPNNRPARSSPLTGTPLVLEGEAEKPSPVPKSEPPAMIVQPGALKPLLGQWTPSPPPGQSAEGVSSRPETPPRLPVSPAIGEKQKLAPTVFAPITAPVPPSLFAPVDKAAITTTTTTASSTFIPTDKTAITTTTPVPTSSLFAPAEKTATMAITSTAPLFSPTASTSSLWNTTSKPTEGMPLPKIPQTLHGGQSGLFGAKTGPTQSLFSSPSPFTSPPVPSIFPSPSSTPPLPKIPAAAPTPAPEQSMQAECELLITTIGKELENLKQLATEASARIEQLRETSGVAYQSSGVGDPRKWVFGDIDECGRVLADVQVDIKELKLQRVSLHKTLKELDSNMLKATMRKEEIARFNKAKTDAEFAKMLKIRTLAPECSETQSQLRKSIRVIRDRVQKLEDHLQSSKRRVNELRTGRPSIRPPTLDTVNRTFRNIHISTDQQKQDVSQLRRRIAKLEISESVGARDQLATLSSKRPLSVTPNIALTTAAALNAERSAQRLKKALLASRTQPLLNTTATASPVPMSFQTPQRVSVAKPDAKKPDTMTSEGAITPPTMPMNFPSAPLNWTPPSELGSLASYDISPSRNRGGTKHHQKPIVLKKNASPAASSTQPSPFEWKPLEIVKPVSALPFALRPAGSS